MIRSLTIEGFRGIQKGELPDLADLSVLVGPNNSGKSTVLEALYLSAAGPAFDALDFVLRRRGWIGPSGIHAVCTGDDGTATLTQAGDLVQRTTIRVHGDRVVYSTKGLGQSAGILREAELQYTSGAGEVPTHVPLDRIRFVEVQTGSSSSTALEDAISQLESAGRRTVLIDLLRPLLPTLSDLRILKLGPRFVLHAQDATGIWPVVYAGDGFKRLLLLAADLAGVGAGGLVLLEEPEVYQHPRSLQQVSRIAWQAVRNGVQVIASTHSLELIDALFQQAHPEDLSRGAVIRLSLANRTLNAVKVPGEKVVELRSEIDEDLRR